VLYNGINPADIPLLNIDDDTAGITVSSVSGTTTSELGDKVTFKVRLDSEPLATVSINIWSNDVTEGTVNPGVLQFTAANWFLDQTMTVTGVDDSLSDGNVAYTVMTDPAVSLDPLYQGMNAANVSLVNVDDDPVATKFYVVNDSTIDRTYEYDASGSLVENYAVFSANTTPRGIATTAAGALFWVIDANRKVYVYNNSGGLQGSWTLGTIPTMGLVEGIATNGTHIWVVDRATRRVYVYLNAASRLSGTQNASTTFSLNPSNSVPKDIVFGSQSGQNYLWVVDDGTGYDRVYRYAINSSGIATSNTNWGLSTQNANPTGITVDPSNGTMDIWVSDSGTDRVYRYAGARTSSLPTLTNSFALDAANSNPQGIADPPPTSNADSVGVARTEVFEPTEVPDQISVDSPLRRSIFTTSDSTVQQRHPLSRSTELNVLRRQLPSRNTKRLEASQRLRTSLQLIAPDAIATQVDDRRNQEDIQASLDRLFANVQMSDDLLHRLN
jgi:hypothetical protein